MKHENFKDMVLIIQDAAVQYIKKDQIRMIGYNERERTATVMFIGGDEITFKKVLDVRFDS